MVGVLGDYASTFKIKSFRKHLAIYIFSFTAKDVFNAVFIFFCVYALSTSVTLGANLLSLSIIGVPMTILSGFLFVKIGPSNLFKVAYSIMIVCLLGFWAIYLLQPSSMILSLFIVAGIYQIGRSMLEFTPWNVYPFIPDVDEIVTQQRREGLFAAVMTFFRKTSVAIATLIVGLLLEWGGFVQGADIQSPEAIQTIVYTLVFGTIALLLISLGLALTFKLNKETHGILVDEIDRLKNNGSKQDVDPKTRKVVEDLTGYNYDKVWGGNIADEK